MAFHPDTLKQAIDAQKKAAHTKEQQVRLVAGPGTGKSRTIEQRVVWLLEQGVEPKNIAVVSFTNASVRDLRERIYEACNKAEAIGANNLRISTLHSLALGVLKSAGQLKQYPVDPVVLSTPEVQDFIYDPEFGLNSGIQQGSRCTQIRRFFEAFWSTGQRDSATYIAPDPPITPEEEETFLRFHSPTSHVYSCVLPGEIVLKCVEQINSNLLDLQEILKLQHLIVDEYQDLNPVDLAFVDALAQSRVCVFVAGDDDQSVYAFRHASPAGIQKFTEKYSKAGVHILNHCFRCTPQILETAKNLITRNSTPDRIPKQLQSLYASSSPAVDGAVHLWRFQDARQEAFAIASSCQRLIQTGLPPEQIFILLANAQRTHQLWPLVEDQLQQTGLPYSPPYEEMFVASPAGLMVQALCRIVCNRGEDGTPLDAVAHRLLVGLRQGVGHKTCDTLRKFVLQTQNYTYFDLFYNPLPSTFSDARARTALTYAREICDELRDWKSDDTVQSRLSQITAIVQSAQTGAAADQWSAYASLLPSGFILSELLEYMTANTDEDRIRVITRMCKRTNSTIPKSGTPTGKIRVMTMHGAKGLAASVVFIPGMEEGVIPNTRALSSQASIMEFARLLYVSITRARAACIMSYAQNRVMAGKREPRTPSRFFGQMGKAIANRTSGLTNMEVSEIIDTVNRLN